jgi:hypothetical protein
MGNKSKKQSPSAESFDARFLDATADNALALLEEVGDKAPALVDAWIKADLAAAVFEAAHAESAPALARKNARRGLNVLKSRGTALPDRKREPSAASTDDPVTEAWFLTPDQSGVAVYTIGTRATGQRFDIVDVQLHESAGVIDIKAGEATRSTIREGFKRIESQRGYGPVPVPLAWARWRISVAKTLNPKSGLILPLGFDTAAHLLTPAPASEPAHPIDQLELAVDDDEIAKRAESSAALHNEPEFRSWLPEIQFVNELLQKVGERIGPQPDQDPDKINAMFAEEISAAVDRFFTPEVRARIASRMKDAAVSTFHRAGRDRALDVLATAEAAKRAGLITSPPSDIPFLKAFFQKALSLVAASQGGKLNIPVAAPPPARSGVVAPAEALEEAAKTRAGLRDAEPPVEPTPEPSEG